MDDNNRLYDKIDKIDDRLDKMSIILERNTLSLEIHEKRTTLSESRITKLEEESIFFRSLVKIFTGILASASSFVAVIELIRLLKS